MKSPVPTTLSIRETAAQTGLTAHTLRYYEQAGLLGRVPRASSGHRRYGEDELRLLAFIRKLQLTGMPIRTMRRYCQALRRGDSTVAERRAILVEHQQSVLAQLAELESCRALIDKKVALYDQLLKHPPQGART